LEYWGRKINSFLRDPEHRWPKELFPLDAFEAVLQRAGDPNSFVGNTSIEYEGLL
jgi:hypothetical protein